MLHKLAIASFCSTIYIMVIGDRIKQVRQKSKLSQELFAQSIGLERANYSLLELNRHNPTLQVLQAISKIYGVSYQWLIDGREGKMSMKTEVAPYSESQIVDTSGYSLIPVTDIKAAAGEGYLNQDIIDETDVIRLPPNMIRGGNHLCIRIKGTSMAPTLQDGGYVIIRMLDRGDWSTMLNDRIYVVVDMEGKTFLKRLKNRLSGEKGFIVLTSDSPDKMSNPSFNLNQNEIQYIWYVEWYFTAKMPNIHDQYYSRLSNLEDTVQEIQHQFLEFKKKQK